MLASDLGVCENGVALCVVHFEDLSEELRGVGFLVVLGGLRVWDRGVFGVGIDEILCCAMSVVGAEQWRKAAYPQAS